MFNSYFLNIVVELNKNIQYSNKNIYENITSNKSYIFIKPISSIEIENMFIIVIQNIVLIPMILTFF